MITTPKEVLSVSKTLRNYLLLWAAFIAGLLILLPLLNYETENALRYIPLAGFLISIISFLLATSRLMPVQFEIKILYPDTSNGAKHFLTGLWFLSKSPFLLFGLFFAILIELHYFGLFFVIIGAFYLTTNNSVLTNTPSLMHRSFSNRIVLDMHPSMVTFSCSHKKQEKINSIKTIIQIDNTNNSIPVLIGGCVPDSELIIHDCYKDRLADMHCINIFDPSKPLPHGTILTREKYIELFFWYGFQKTDPNKHLPSPKPLVFILGADRFNHLFEDPKKTFRNLSIAAGAEIVFFDTTELKPGRLRNRLGKK